MSRPGSDARQSARGFPLAVTRLIAACAPMRHSPMATQNAATASRPRRIPLPTERLHDVRTVGGCGGQLHKHPLEYSCEQLGPRHGSIHIVLPLALARD